MADAVHEIVPEFIDAFNRGDLSQLSRLFADSNFAWYATDAPGQRFDAAAKDGALCSHTSLHVIGRMSISI